MKDSSVILIHGMSSTSNTLSTLRERLETIGYSVYSPNLPWHEDAIRDSDIRVSDLSILDYATYLRDYIANLKLEEPPILMGHSMGGLLAQKLSAGAKVRASFVVPGSAVGNKYHHSSCNLDYLQRLC